jgi:outer membrane protein TolC
MRFSLTLIVAISAGTNAAGQQPTVVRESTPPATTTATQTPTGPGQTGQVPQQLPTYYDYPYGSTTTKNRTLSVEQAVTLALDNAASLRQAQFDEQIASEDVKQARAALLPQFNLPLTYWGTTPSKVRQPGDPLTFSFVASSAINESIGWLSTTGTIDVAGKLRAQLQASRALLAAAHAGTMAARRNLVLATIDAYYGLALTRQKRRLADEALALAEGFASVTQEQQKRGSAEEVDVLRARSAARSRRDEFAQAQLSESLTMSQLRVLTGLDYATYITVIRLSASEQVIGLPAYQEDTIKLRPELAQLDAQKRAALAEARAARRELWPQLTYTLNGGFDAANFSPLGRYSGGSAMITLNVPIFNFGASKSRATQAELRARSLDVQRDNQVLQLKQEFYAARAGALSALDRTGFAAQAAAAAQQNLNLIFDRYHANKATLLEVLDAESDYSTTRLEYYQAIVDYHSARARLELDPTQIFGKQGAPVIQPEVKAPPPPCSLGREQAPKLDRLYLGMTESQVKQLVPGIQISAVDELGVSNAEVKGADLGNLVSSGSFFEGVQSIALHLTDGRLSYVRVAYPVTNKWASKSEFLSVMAPKFSVRADWKPFYDWRNKDVRDAEDLGDLAIECEGFRLALGIGIEEVGGNQTPHYDLDDLAAAQVVKQREDQQRRLRQEQQKVKP